MVAGSQDHQNLNSPTSTPSGPHGPSIEPLTTQKRKSSEDDNELDEASSAKDFKKSRGILQEDQDFPEASQLDALTVPAVSSDLTTKVLSEDDGLEKAVGDLLDSIDMTQTCLSELQVGISRYINPHLPTFSAILKHRFTDFLVHEVDASDQIVHLKDIGNPSKKPSLETAPKPVKVEAETDVAWPPTADERLIEILAKEKLEELQSFVLHGPPGGRKTSCPKRLPNPTSDLTTSIPECKDSCIQNAHSTEKLKDGKPSNNQNLVTSVISDPIDSKEQRKVFHQTIREVFQGKLITEHKQLEGDASAIEISWARPGKSHERKPRPVEVNPPYIHFTLQKTNRETQDALAIISRQLHCHVSRDLAIAGTKDKRSVSCQRVSLKRGKRTIEDVWARLNNISRTPKAGHQISFTERGDKGIRVGDFTYEKTPLKLGDLRGNRFTVVLRDVIPAKPQILKEAVMTLSTHGFLNYFGMQRFGTTAVGTHIVGLSLLRGDWDLAIDLIMRKKLGESQDAELARSLWSESNDAKAALNLMPRRCVAERSILQFFSKQLGQTDKCGALASIPKNLKMMYIHAYQSYVWNTVLSRRVELFGCDKPVIGDLVQLNKDETPDIIGQEQPLESLGEDSEILTKPNKVDSVKVLKTLEDVQSYTIYDVVLPLAGYNIIYPGNEIGELYLKMIRRDGLDPDRLYRSQAEYSMAGAYRKILHLPKDVNCQLYEYEDPELPLSQADEDILLGLESPSLNEWVDDSNDHENKNLALKVEFTLGSSAYATMALREILKSDTGKEAQSRMTQRMRERMSNSCHPATTV